MSTIGGDRENPFVTLEDNTDQLLYPKFKASHKLAFGISQEAFDQLDTLTREIFVGGSTTHRIAQLLEALGTHTLKVTKPETVPIPDSHETTEDIRQAGFLDAIAGHPARFIPLYQKKTQKSVFEKAYLRGFLEGQFIKMQG